jgi:hypothetical protein
MFLSPTFANRLWVLRTCGAWAVLFWASTAFAEGLKINSTFEAGVDAWSITPRLPAQPPGDFRDGNAYEDHMTLDLPDADTKWNYRPLSPWVRLASQIRLNSNWEANFKVRADQLMGVHLDVANVDWSPSPYLGLRAGVVNFNTNWCRTYDVDSPWITEPDAFCRRNDNMRINNAAPGLQAYTNTLWGAYQMQTIVGIYRPMLFAYEPKEFGFNYRKLRENFKYLSNDKISAAVNLLNLQTGTQLRLGLMRSEQAGLYSPRLTEDDRARRNSIHNYYLGIDTYLRPSLRLRYSTSQFASHDYYDNLLVLQGRDKFEALELIYDWKSSDFLALGWSRTNQAVSVDDEAFNRKIDDYFKVLVSSQFISWRHQWGKGIHSIVQWTHASQTNGYYGNRRSSSGDALGVRLAYQY